MSMVVEKDSIYLLNHCARSLARDTQDARHNYGQFAAEDERSAICEAWRFPIIDSYRTADGGGQGYNLVSFIYVHRGQAVNQNIGIIGSFTGGPTPVSLSQVNDSHYWAISFAVPKGQIHTYKFVVEGKAILDPINPQRTQRADGSTWSRFFTECCTQYVVLQRWEAQLLERLTTHILPFRTTEGQRWLSYYYESLESQQRKAQFPRAYRLDQSVGAASFIDKLLARQEQHRQVDYQICLELCYKVLKDIESDSDPLTATSEAYARLYDLLSDDREGAIPQWDYNLYRSPSFFLQLLRRHTYTGAFSHPKHGGNVGAAGWQFLASNLTDPLTKTLPRQHATTQPPTYFDWARSQEPPLGRSPEYRG